MRVLLTAVCICALATSAFAAKEAQQPVQVLDVDCGLVNVCADFNFGGSDGGFLGGNACDLTGGAAVWAWGTAGEIPAPPAGFGPNVWGTVIGANYPNDSGDGLLSPAFDVTDDCYLLEVTHYVHIETNFDGGNVVVVDGGGGETLVSPMTGYPSTISTSATFYAFCTNDEMGFTGNGFSGPSEEWTTRCFDLSAFNGQNVQVRLDFGSDSSVTYPGWYVAGATLGGLTSGTPTENETWGGIKNLYR